MSGVSSFIELFEKVQAIRRRHVYPVISAYDSALSEISVGSALYSLMNAHECDDLDSTDV